MLTVLWSDSAGAGHSLGAQLILCDQGSQPQVQSKVVDFKLWAGTVGSCCSGSVIDNGVLPFECDLDQCCATCFICILSSLNSHFTNEKIKALRH